MRQLVADLHVGRPDVVEELDLDHRLDAASRQADRAADDVGLGERRVVDPVAAELLLQSPGDLEDAALALHLAEVLLAAGVGHVLAEDDDARIARHLVLQAGVEQVHHRGRVAGELRIVLGVELLGGRIDVGRVDVLVDACRAPGCGEASAVSVATSTSSVHLRSGCAPSSASVAMPCCHERSAGSVVSGIPLRRRPRARPAGGSAPRRRRASGCRGGSRGRAPAPDPCAARRSPPPGSACRRRRAGRSRPLPGCRAREAGHELGDRAAGGVAPRPGPRWRTCCPRPGRRRAA